MYLQIQLKVCEGCGLLWYRMSARASVYCSKCEGKLGSFPAPRTRRRPGGRRKREEAAVRAGAISGNAGAPLAVVVGGCR